MNPTRFSRGLGLALVAGLFYIGHGLHAPGESALPSWSSTARADDRFNSPVPVPAFPVPKGFKWEPMPTSNGQPSVYRAKMPGGWLVATTVDPSGAGAGVHTVFIADVYHWWEAK